MSCCYCPVTPKALSTMNTQMHAMAQFRAGMALDPILLQLKLAAQVSAQADVNAILGLEGGRLPNVTIAGGGPLMQMAMMVKLTPGTFSLFDPIKLQEELALSAKTMASSRTAKLFAIIAKLDVALLMKMSLIARLMLQLKLKGLDPMSASFSETMNASAASGSSSVPALMMPKLRLLAGLPTIVQAMETLKVPLGDPAAARSTLSARMSMLASITPPRLPLPPPLILKAVAKLEMIAKIQEAFGADAFTPAGHARIKAMLSAMARLKLNVKLKPALPLPPMEDIKMGEKIAGSSFMKAGISGVGLPKLAILPAINATLAARAVLALHIPSMDCMGCG